MNSKKRKERSSSWHTIYLTLIFFLTLVVLYFSLPQERRFRYEFHKGRPWMHETLIAPYTFAILKSEKTISLEKDSVLNNLVPYLDLEDSIGKKQLLAVSNKIDEIFRKAKTEIFYPRVIKPKVLDIFEKIYNKGILEQTASNYPFLNNKRKEVYIIHDNVARKAPVEQLYSLKNAYTEVVAELNDLKETDKDLKITIERLKPEEFLSPNLVFDKDKTEAERAKVLENISTTRGVIQEGERIVAKGDVITPQTFIILESLKNYVESNRGDLKKYYLIVIGKLIFLSVLLLTLFLFIYNIRRNLLKSKRDITFTLIMMMLMVFFYRIAISYDTFPIYIVPFTVLALIIRTFLDARLAIFVNTITALIIGFMVPNGYEFVVLSIPAGSIAVITQNKLQRREQIIWTSIIIFLSYAVTYTGITLMQEATLYIDLSHLKWFLVNAVLTLITYLLVFVMEKSFGFISDVTLIELSNSSQKLLRRLSEEAPGTNQHSLQVANLSEEAILRLGGNALLARAGAMYHDIGKIAQPQYFTENQAMGLNPHQNHTPLESAQIILEHLDHGVELARKHKLPDQIIDFIRTHHGTTKTAFFFSKNGNGSNGSDERKFTYPGPLPFTRETAVVMLADSVEAASRSLVVKSSENFSKIIDLVFSQKIEAGQLNDAPLTFKDINLLKEVFLEKLQNIYHVRVAYPQ
jgi:putative nucleotidyltransferase with HDIG domain